MKTEWQSVRASHSSTVAWPAQSSRGQVIPGQALEQYFVNSQVVHWTWPAGHGWLGSLDGCRTEPHPGADPAHIESRASAVQDPRDMPRP